MAARDLLIHAANVVGFPSPAPTQGLAEWADESLDTSLVRGSPAWAQAHAHVLDALVAASSGQGAGVQKALAQARDRVRAEGRKACSCPANAKGRVVRVTGRAHCVKCGGRA